MMNFTKMVESELLALNEAAPPPPPPPPPTAAPVPVESNSFYGLLENIAKNNLVPSNINDDLIPLIVNGSSLGRGGQRYSSKPQLLRERQNFPLLDLGYSIWTHALLNGVKPDDINRMLKEPNVTMGDVLAVVRGNSVMDLTKMLTLLSWDNLSNVKFKDFEEHDFKSPRLRQLFNVAGGGIAINSYHNKTILETLLEITKIKSKTQKFNYNEKSVLDMIYYPLDYARGKKSMDVSLSRGLLPCVESIISWYIDNIEKNKLIDKNVGEDATVVGSELARKKDFQLQKGYIQLLNGVTNIELKSVEIPDVTKTGITPDANYDNRKLNSIEKVADCKSIAPEIYNAISIYAQENKEKSNDFAERFKTAGQAFGGIFTT